MNEEKRKLPTEYKFVELPNEEFQKLWSEWGAIIFQSNDASQLECGEKAVDILINLLVSISFKPMVYIDIIWASWIDLAFSILALRIMGRRPRSNNEFDLRQRYCKNSLFYSST